MRFCTALAAGWIFTTGFSYAQDANPSIPYDGIFCSQEEDARAIGRAFQSGGDEVFIATMLTQLTEQRCLSNGSTPAIIRVDAVLDREANTPYAHQNVELIVVRARVLAGGSNLTGRQFYVLVPVPMPPQVDSKNTV